MLLTGQEADNIGLDKCNDALELDDIKGPIQLTHWLLL